VTIIWQRSKVAWPILWYRRLVHALSVCPDTGT
jgi:hypothetical protein